MSRYSGFLIFIVAMVYKVAVNIEFLLWLHISHTVYNIYMYVCIYIYIYIYFLSLALLGPLPWHMEGPRLGV